jgi:hypothetical protein
MLELSHSLSSQVRGCSGAVWPWPAAHIWLKSDFFPRCGKEALSSRGAELDIPRFDSIHPSRSQIYLLTSDVSGEAEPLHTAGS